MAAMQVRVGTRRNQRDASPSGGSVAKVGDTDGGAICQRDLGSFTRHVGISASGVEICRLHAIP